ncbi:hypothetical protein FQZ97_1054890 [compost metagenome]
MPGLRLVHVGDGCFAHVVAALGQHTLLLHRTQLRLGDRYTVACRQHIKVRLSRTQDQVALGLGELRLGLLDLGASLRDADPVGDTHDRLRQLQVPRPAIDVPVLIGTTSKARLPVLAAAVAVQVDGWEYAGPGLR